MESLDWTPYLAGPDETPESAHARWYTAGLVDGLPIVPPTIGRIRALYRSAGMDPTLLLGVVEPSLRPVTAYDAAVCAVAAGCVASHLPLLGAAVRAVCEPAFNLLGIQTTTGTATPVIIVHGLAARSAGVSGDSDCLGGSYHANAAIGRALRLVLRAVGGGGPAAMDHATMGQPAKLGLCFAENLQRSPWSPLHTELGFGAADGAVTVVGISGTVEIVHADDGDPHGILDTLAASLTIAGSVGSQGLLGGGSPLVVLSPEHARHLSDAGYTRAGVRRAVWDRAILPWDRIAPSVVARLRSGSDALDSGGTLGLRVARDPADIIIAVAGGIGVKSTIMPSWGGGTRPVTVRI
jgi:hypothetical protein